MNTFGKIYTLTSFGESHGTAVGGVIDGVPAGEKISVEVIQQWLDRRRPGQSSVTTSRNESDKVEILSGLMPDGETTTGMPIGFIVRNTSQRSSDYDNIANTFRPSHADYTYTAKYGLRDHRGGGRSSARETISRVVAGAVAMQILERHGVTVKAYASAIGGVEVNKIYKELNLDAVYDSDVRCPDAETADAMRCVLSEAVSSRDTLGGVITCVVQGCPAGLGDPVFGKLQARLADAMMSINAAKGFEYGMGFDGAAKKGSEMIDEFFAGEDGSVHTVTNHSGGIQGGISNGEDIYMRVAFKPIATLPRPVSTVDRDGNSVTLEVKGRHDPCVIPRAVPVVASMAAITILDALLLSATSKI